MSPNLPTRANEGIRTKRTALVVDDLEDMLDLLEIALDAANFTVLRASSASDALDLFTARADEIDLLMTDIHVGTESGLEMARRMQATKPSLPVLAISGFALDGRLVSGQSRIEFLPKPFSTSELRTKLDSMFSPQFVTLTISSGPNQGYKVTTRCNSPVMAPPKTGLSHRTRGSL